jgi:uncharacterized FlaG/YvyC family protein
VNVSSVGNQVSAPAETAASHTAQPATAQQRALIQAVKAISPTELFGENTELTFVMDPKLNKMIVRVIDRSSGEVRLQIPAEYMVRLAEEMKGG